MPIDKLSIMIINQYNIMVVFLVLRKKKYNKITFLKSDRAGTTIGQGFPRIHGSYPNLGGETGHKEG